MGKYAKYIFIPEFPNPLFGRIILHNKKHILSLKRIILDKEKHILSHKRIILDKEKQILSHKRIILNKEKQILYHRRLNPINWEDPPQKKVCNYYYLNLPLLPLHIADLIIGEATDLPPPDRPFCRFTLHRRCPGDQTNKIGSYNWHCRWEFKQKSLADDWQELGSNSCSVALVIWSSVDPPFHI